MKQLIRTIILSCVACFGILDSRAFADVVTQGHIVEVRDEFGFDLGSTVDLWYFTLNAPGLVIDTLSWEKDSADLFDGDGNFTESVDLNGDGEIAFLDVYIHLYGDDGNLDAGDLLAFNDDSSNTYGDGSIYQYDSYLNLPTLPAGNYILALGAYPLSTTNAIDGINGDAYYYPTTVDGFGSLIEIDRGDYQVTFTGNLSITGLPAGGSIVPEPGTVTLGGIGLAMMACLRRRAITLSV